MSKENAANKISNDGGKKRKAKQITEDYEVGYKKPPVNHQFKPGKSGNPKGRPKNSKNFNTLLMRELETTVLLQEGGKTVEASKLQAFVKRMVNNAIQGNVQAMKMLSSILGTDPEVEPEKLVDQDDLLIVQRLIQQSQSSTVVEGSPGNE